jgi:amidohydrolase
VSDRDRSFEPTADGLGYGLEHPDATLMAMLGTLRRSLHATPEPSGAEAITASVIDGFVSRYGPDQLLRGLGGHGLAAVFNGMAPGPTVLIRADLDAVPVEGRDHGSSAHSRHLCGHDGHMTMVAGIAPLLAGRRPPRGRIVLLFQPAEETGMGAAAVLADPRFAAIRPDVAVGLHNLPGFAPHAAVVRSGVMASASVGLRCKLVGVASHAAEPHAARSPRLAIAELLAELPELEGVGRDGRLVTLTHVSMGRPGFGVTPGRGEVFATLRAHTNDGLAQLRSRAEAKIRATAAEHELDCGIRWFDDFPATTNDAGMVESLRDVCHERGIAVIEVPRPFPWSDDFGHIAAVTPSVYFGLGIGIDAVGLHQPGYTFPDDVMRTGIQLLHQLALRFAEERAVAGPLDGPPTYPDSGAAGV